MNWKFYVDIMLFLVIVSISPKPHVAKCLNLKPSPHMSVKLCLPLDPSKKGHYYCKVKCDEHYFLESEMGYYEEIMNAMICLDERSFYWYTETLICSSRVDLKPCPDHMTPPMQLNKKECTVFDGLKSKCNIFCAKGYYFVGEKDIKCNFVTGKWGQTKGGSIESKCVADEGKFSCTGREVLLGMKTVDCKIETQDPNIVGCSLKCSDKDKFVKNDSLVFCNIKKKTFEWYLGKAKCSSPRKACPDYPKLNEYVGAYECDAEDGFKNHCKLFCPDGFDMIGESFTKCDFKTGKWVQKTFCKFRYGREPGCDGNSPAPNMTAYHCTTGKLSLECKLHCGENYKLVGDDVVECRGSGYFQWRGKEPTCESIRKACPDHPKLAHNLKFKECDAKDGLKTKCNLYCDKGYFLVGETQMQCYFDSGKWGQTEGPFIDSKCERGKNPLCHECYKKSCRGPSDRPICRVLELDTPGAKPVGTCRCYCREHKDCSTDPNFPAYCADDECQYPAH